MRNIILILIILVIGSSCMTERKCNRRFPPIIKDSIVTRETIEYRDRTVYDTIIPDTVTKTIMISQLDTDTVTVESGYMIAKLTKDQGLLKLQVISKDTVIARLLKEAEVLRSKITERHTVEIHQVKYIPKFYKFTFWWFWAIVVVIIVYVVYQIYGSKLKLLKYLKK